MSARYIGFPEADRDLDDIADYLVEEANPETGLRFLTVPGQTFALLAEPVKAKCSLTAQ